MIPRDLLFLLPRDEPRGSAADALALTAGKSRSFEAAAILAMAAALDTYYVSRAKERIEALPEPTSAYEVIVRVVAALALKYARAEDEVRRLGGELPSLKPLRAAEEYARCSSHAAEWLAPLLYHSRRAIEASREASHEALPEPEAA
jgi:hypothetical protein